MRSYLNPNNITGMGYLQRNQQERLTQYQVENSAGGYVWEVDKWDRAKRFLVLGSEGGTYYATESDITRQNVRCLEECIKESPLKMVTMLKDMRFKVYKRDTIIYALALVYKMIPEEFKPPKNPANTYPAIEPYFCVIVRTGSDLLQFCAFVDTMRGWGPALRRVVGTWYENHVGSGSLEYQVVKYQNRHGWTHKDVLRKIHYDSYGGTKGRIFRWIVGATHEGRLVNRKGRKYSTYYQDLSDYPAPEYIEGYEQLKRAGNRGEVVALIEKHGFTHEMIPTRFKNEPVVWDALLQKMPMIAMVRNLGKMTKVGLVLTFSDAAQTVIGKLDEGNVRKSRAHPLQFLTACLTYRNGAGVKGSLKWDPVGSVVGALEGAFHYAFDNVEPSGVNTIVAIDMSSSMLYGNICNIPNLTPCMASAALAMVIAKTEPNYHIMGFSNGIKPLTVSDSDSLGEVMRKVNEGNYGGTDCSLPIRYALDKNLDVGMFTVLTDNETWAGEVHCSQLLKHYRQNRLGNPYTEMSESWKSRESAINAKFATVAMTATNFTIADPNDPGMLDIVGFSSDTPQLLSSFAKGEI